MNWSISKDRSVADTQRNLIWNKINELSVTLNVTSLHKIKVSVGQGGSITPLGSDYYAPDNFFIVGDGESQTFTATADPGYRIQCVIVDGVSQGPVVNYTFSEVNKDHSIVVLFAPDTTSSVLSS